MKKLPFFCALLFSFSLFAQIGPGTWQDHLSLNSCYSVARLGTKIYSANYTGLFKFDETEFSPEPLNKINGLSDVNVKLLRTNPYNNKLLVIYQNSNIDVIGLDENLVNYPDLKIKTFNGKKIVNEVYFQNQYAYLACGFGIVLFDTEKLEIKDTYFIGPGGSQLEVYQLALNDSLIFAATPTGLYKSNYKLKSLNNFNNWTMVSKPLPTGPYCGVVNVDDKILSVYAPSKLNPSVVGKDSIYVLTNNVWAKYPAAATSPNTIKKVSHVYGDWFSVVDQFGALVRSVNTGQVTNYITSFNGREIQILDFYYGKDSQGNISYWVADYQNGLYQTYGPNPSYSQNKVFRNGINRSLVNNIDVLGGKLAISPSHPEDAGGTIYTDQGINVMREGDWKYIEPRDFSNTIMKDITFAYFDRKDKTRLWGSAWGAGLLQYRNDTLVKIYNPTNCSMPEVLPGNPRCTGLSMDEAGNLWLANSDVKNFISVVKKDGSFQNFTFDAARFTRKILVDKNNYVWAIHERDGGITVFNHNNFSTPILNGNYKVLTKAVGNGNLGTNAIFSIAEDKEGKIWLGTSEGVRVFYNPSAIFTSSSFDAQPIKIVQDGNVELLLGHEVITTIAVDGADNKWIGTQSGGLFCFSPDGLTQLNHFTSDNSPLYSNSIVDVNYDAVSGDVFIGTEFGLQSYRSSIIEGDKEYSLVYAYPNPVKPNYTGKVYVRGLIDNSIVKIVDEAGNMVWETKSNGGQIEWPVATLSGSRVVSGVYIVYATSTDGEQKALTKILVIN